MRIRGKGNKERRVYAEGGADLLLASWLEMRGEGDPSENQPAHSTIRVS